MEIERNAKRWSVSDVTSREMSMRIWMKDEGGCMLGWLGGGHSRK